MKYTQQLPSTIYTEAKLLKNLNAIALKNKKLFERICWPVSSDHIFFDEKQIPALKIHTSYRSLALPDDVCTKILSSHNKSKKIFFMGVGNSELIDKAFSVCANAKIYIWERDPWLMRLFLMKRYVMAATCV